MSNNTYLAPPFDPECQNNCSEELTTTVSAESRWDKTIANALNATFSSNAQSRTMRVHRPYYPYMPLPIDRPLSKCRDYPEYEWNQTLIRFDRGLADNNYELCHRLLSALESLERRLTRNLSQRGHYIRGYFEAALSLQFVHWDRRRELEELCPPQTRSWVETDNQPIQWRAN